MSIETRPPVREASVAALGKRVRAWWEQASTLTFGTLARLQTRFQPALSRLEPISHALGKVAAFFAPVGAFIVNGPLVRFITANLLRRIFVSNLIGLLFLLGNRLNTPVNSVRRLSSAARSDSVPVTADRLRARHNAGKDLRPGWRKGPAAWGRNE